MIILKNFLIRLVIIAIPLLGWYFWSEYAFEVNRNKEHPTDVGLGMALVICFLLIVMCVGLLIDFIVRIKNKQYQIAITNIPFLLLFSIPILYINCQFGSYCEDCFCSWFIEFVKNS